MMQEPLARVWRKRMCATPKNAQVLSPSCFFHFHHHIFTNCESLVDCEVGQWRAVGECSATCGGGSRTIKREIVQEAEHGGEKCPPLEETMVCNIDECPGNPLPFDLFKNQSMNVLDDFDKA